VTISGLLYEDFFFGIMGFALRAFWLARQALYHLSHSAGPFLCCVFGGEGRGVLEVVRGRTHGNFPLRLEQS
jgi:hypothetical protein